MIKHIIAQAILAVAVYAAITFINWGPWWPGDWRPETRAVVLFLWLGMAWIPVGIAEEWRKA